MSFDGVFTHLMVQELQNQLTSGRVNKIHQPYENEVVFKFNDGYELKMTGTCNSVKNYKIEK